MSPLMKRSIAREAKRQALDNLILNGTPDERVNARSVRKAMSHSWDKREQQPGNFHRPPRKDGSQRFVMR